MAFDLISTQEGSHVFIHPELRNCNISVELKSDASLGENSELIFMESVHQQFTCVPIEK